MNGQKNLADYLSWGKPMNKVLQGISWGATICAVSVADLTAVFGLASVIITIVCSLITTFVPLIRKVNADGKLTADELLELAEAVQQENNKLKEQLEAYENGNGESK